MRHRIWALMLASLLLCGAAFGQSSPSSLSEITYRAATGILTNRHPGEFVLLIRDLGGTTIDSLIFGTTSGTNYIQPNDGRWTLGRTGSRWKEIYGDSLILTNTLIMGGDALMEFVGVGLRNNGGTLEVYLPNIVTTDWITNQTIIGQDIDSTASNIAFQHAFDSTTSDTMRMLMWRGWIETHLAKYPISPVAPTNGQIPSYDAAKDSIVWVANAAAGSGDDIKVDTGNGTQMTSTNWVIVGAGVEKSSDSIIIAGGGGGTGRFGVASDTTFGAKNARLDSVKFVDTDSLTADLVIVSPNVYGVEEIRGSAAADMSFMTTSGHPSAAMNFQLGATAPVKFWNNATEIMSIGSGGVVAAGNALSHLKAWKSLTATDSARIAGQLINGDTAIATEGELEDSLDFYVLSTNENVQRLITRDTLVFLGATAGDTALKVMRYNSAGQDSTVFVIPGIGIFRGTIPTATTFDSAIVNFYLRLNNTGTIKEGLAASFDTVQVDKQLRLNGSVAGYVRIAAAATTTNYDITMPSALGSGGYLYINSSGVGSFAAGGGGGSGGDTLWNGINAQTGQRADSVRYVSRAGDAIIMVGDSGTWTQLSSSDNTGGFQFTVPIRTSGGEIIDNDASLASETEMNTALAAYAKTDSIAFHYGAGSLPKDTISWFGQTGGLAAKLDWTLSGNDKLRIKPGTTTADMEIGNEGLTTADSLDVLTKFYIFSKPWPTSYTNGYQLTIDGSGNYSWAAPGGVSAGTSDSVYFNTAYTATGTQYSSVSNLLKIRAGGGVVWTREDSTSFDLMRLKAAIDNSTIDTTAAGLLQVKALGVGASQIATSAVTNTKLGTNAITLDKMDDASVGTSEVVNASLLFADFAQNGASSGQTFRWNGSAWVASFIDSNMVATQGIALTNLRGTGATAGDFIVWNGSQFITSAGGAGTGTITAVGSYTSGNAFAGSGADEDWLGLGASAGRIQFEANGGSASDDAIEIPEGFLSIGTHTTDNLRGIQMGSNTGTQSDFGMWINQNDSGTSYPCSINLNGTKKNDGTGGGDVYVSWSYKNADAEEMEAYSLGMDASDGYRFKLSKSPHSLTTANDVMIVDSFEKVIFPDGLYLADDTGSTDNKAANLEYARTNGKQTEYIGITGGQVYWTPEPMASVSKFMSNPWIDTTGTYTRVDSMIARTYLWRVTDTTASNDTLFVVTQWQADVACSLFAVNYCGKTSSATAGTSSLDSVVVYVNGTRNQGIKPAFASTILDTIAINFTNIQLAAQDLVTLEWRYVLGNDATADAKWANIERRKR